MLRETWVEEREAARSARSRGDLTGEWRHLERAHILSQRKAGLHVRTHVAMLGAAIRRRDAHEVLGQLFRLVVAGPGSLTGRYPVGNTGGADVSAFKPMDIPEDLRAALEEPEDAKAKQTRESEEFFTTDVEGLPEVREPSVVRLRDGDHLDLRIEPVRKSLDGSELRMLAYNGSIPGPTLHVDEGSEITVHVSNAGDVEATVHWHGLRLENKYDGVPHETQEPIAIGDDFTYKVQFPDPGVYWYHPHIREDLGLELGLYGMIVVEPSDPAYWPRVDRHLTITLDDLFIEDGRISPFSKVGPTFVAMGRYGNVMLTNGETEFSGEAAVGEVVRLYLVNTANTRIFNFALAGARMKLVGGDSGRYERETFVEEVMLAPSERAVVDVLFHTPGDVRLEHRTPDRVYDLGGFTVATAADGTAAATFADLRTDLELTALRATIDRAIARPPDKSLVFFSKMPILYGDETDQTVTSYVCPMHSESTAAEPGECPICGMKLVAAEPVATLYVCPMHSESTAAEPGACPICGMKLVPADGDTAQRPEPSDEAAAQPHAHEHEAGDGLEWEDEMLDINRQTNPANMIWQLIDPDSDAVNDDIVWNFTVGDQVKIRLVNDMTADHPMHHPFHVHGAGRMLILARDGKPEPNLVWKDTVLLRAGETVDVVLDVSNPGLWMAHCHIAEHNQSGMMFSFNVARRAEAEPAR
jgi:FtsP/CotA-like multicopper oxidase with cupredoxin domain